MTRREVHTFLYECDGDLADGRKCTENRRVEAHSSDQADKIITAPSGIVMNDPWALTPQGWLCHRTHRAADATKPSFDPKLIAAFDRDMAVLNKYLDMALDAFQNFHVLGGETFATARMVADLKENETITRDRMIELFVTAITRIVGNQ